MTTKTIKMSGETLTITRAAGGRWQCSDGSTHTTPESAARHEATILVVESGDDPADYATEIEAAARSAR